MMTSAGAKLLGLCCDRVHGMSDWINNVEKLMKEMNQENISSDEYKDMLARFQVSSSFCHPLVLRQCAVSRMLKSEN